MQTALRLNETEKFRFMRALYSVFYRDQDINAIEKSVLATLNQVLDVSLGNYDHYVHNDVKEIAREVNGIADIRVRIYFMRIIHDVYLEEIKLWFKGPETKHAIRLRSIYTDLQGLVDVATTNTNTRSNG